MHPRTASFASRLAPVLLVAASAGCAASPVVRAASEGKLAGLRDSVAAEVKSGKMSGSEATDLARALAKREIEQAAGEEGARRLRELASCARQLGRALDQRADKRDAIGAAAQLLRIDAGLDDADDFVAWSRVDPGSPEAAWRAVGARSLVWPSRGTLRRRFFADPDQEARLGALRAAIDAADPDDAEGALEAARLDPHPPARVLAIRAAGAIGGETIVLGLKDLWPHADESAREAIAAAWGTLASLDAGGRRELLWAADTQRGGPAIAAALALLRAGGEGRGEAVGVLERAVKEGPTHDRVHAIDTAPLGISALRDAIGKAETDPDEVVAVEAMARRLEAPVDQGGAAPGSPARAGLVEKLLAIAKGEGLGVLAAKGILARAGVREVAPLLEHDGAAPEAKTRAIAGTALAVLGDLPRAAIVAADPDPLVRTTVSCAILRASAR